MAVTGIGSVAAGQLSDRAPLSRAQSQPNQWTLAKVRRKLQGNVPDSIVAVIRNMLNDKPESLGTDWNGTFRIEGLLRWSRRGLREALEFARLWLDYHLEHDPRMTDEEFLDSYGGARSRVIRSGILPFTTYAGFFGLAFACYELHQQTGDPKARQVSLDVSNAILHVAARDKRGLVAHDDGRVAEFAILDVVYFAARALMTASLLDERTGAVYRKQAIYQIRSYTDIFLDRRIGLAKTVLFPSGLGQTYWCRASGWLMWGLTAVLRHLPKEHEAFRTIASDLETLADGVVRAQGPNGGLRVLVNDKDTPEEASGTAMCVAGIHEAVRKGWIPGRYSEFVDRGWRFVESNVTRDGQVRNVYTGWAMPAEERQMLMDHKYHGWIPGLFLIAADEMHPSS